MSSPNLNYLWSSLIVEELIRNGVDYFCISPGSRSSPLVCAVADNPKAKTFVHFDERGTAFHALGYTSATGKPCVLICTSGTALANFFPAIIEASKKKLPLIILTADRPPELRLTGANQTIDQIKIFGEYVRFFFDLPTPSQEIKPEFVLTTIDQAVFRSQGELPGPVHLNCPFREPLAPVQMKGNFKFYLESIKNWIKTGKPYTSYIRSEKKLNAKDTQMVCEILRNSQKGIIAVGKLSCPEDSKAIYQLAEKLNWPIFPDITSGLRLGCAHPNIISYFDQILMSANLVKIKTDCVLHLGGRLTSKRFYEYLPKNDPQNYIVVLNHPLRNDPLHKVSLRIQSKTEHFCKEIIKGIKSANKSHPFLKLLKDENKKIDLKLEKMGDTPQLTETIAVRLLSKLLPKDSGLFIASSLPIREMDMVASPNANPVVVSSNRGASGIDGTIASSVGFAVGLNKPTTLLIGDLAFLHDLNSLAMLKNLHTPLVIVALNNNGGRLFSKLPIAEFKSYFEKFFLTPHNLRFEHAAQLFKIPYFAAKNLKELTAAYQAAIKKHVSTLIEVVC